MVSIVISNPNRTNLLKLGTGTLLRDYNKQVEFVFIEKINLNNNDINFEDFCNRLKSKGHKIIVIKIDDNKCIPKMKINNPSYTLNIGFKYATNEIILKTDPEILHCYNTIEYIENNLKQNQVIFGKILHGNKQFRENIDNGVYNLFHSIGLIDKPEIKDLNVCSELYKNPYYYIMGINKSDFIKIGGIHEEYLSGFAGEDDDFGDILRCNNFDMTWTNNILGIHIDHSKDNDLSKYHLTDIHLKNINLLKHRQKMRSLGKKEFMVSNYDKDWGNDSAVLDIKRYN